MDIIIDRIIGNTASIELPEGAVIDVPLLLFDNPKEGDIFTIVKNTEKRKEREENIKKLMDDLWAD